MDTDVRDVTTGPGERDRQLEGGRRPDRFDRHVGAETVGEAAHDLERVLAGRGRRRRRRRTAWLLQAAAAGSIATMWLGL